MPLKLDGTYGVSGIDGTASTPSLRGSDLTGNGIVYGTDTVQIATGGTTAVTVDSSQNVGVGTTTPVNNSGYKSLTLSGTSGGVLEFVAGSTNTAQVFADSGTLNFLTKGAYPLVFYTNNSEKARIDSSGNLLVGTTTSTNYGNFANNYKSATLSSGTTTSYNKSFSITNDSTPVSNTTVDALRFLDAAGNVIGNAAISGIVSIYIRGASGGNGYAASFILSSAANGTTSASIALIGTAQTRGTSPVTSVQLANDGASGSVKVTVTYINNALVNSGLATATFTGVVSGA